MNKRSTLFRSASFAVMMASVFTLAACGKKQETPQMGKIPVGVVTLATQSVVLTAEVPGRTAPYRVAEVRPQVSGIVQKRLFTEGGSVKAGEPLYQIDAALFQANLNSQQAVLTRAEAQRKTAALLAERYKPLLATHAVSQQAYDNAVATRDQATADVLSAKAALETARINLVYTKVLSPIGGIIGRSSVTEGALLTANQPTALASVQQIDPIYVDMSQSSAQRLRMQSALANGQQGDASTAPPVTLTLEDGTTYAHTGKLQFAEVTVDAGTGAVLLRAVFPNPEHRLLPGMFVRAQIPDGTVSDGILVPQRGVTFNQLGQPTALVVNAEGKVESRELKTDRAIGSKWLVTSGLAAGDKVIVEGLQTARPGMSVEATEVSTQPAKTAAGPAKAK